MGVMSTSKIFGVTIRESANDGSDFTNPDADYRRLFLGEDGELHVKDSAGTVTSIGGGSGGMASDPLWDAKGDIAAATAANTGGILTVGANDTILMADSGQTTGLKWVASGTPSTQAFGDAAAVGTADTFTRGDHKHAMPANPFTFSGVKVRETTAQSIAHNSATTLLFDEEDFDTDAYHESVTNPGRLTVPSGAGNNKKYHVAASVAITAATGGQRQLTLRLDGTTVIAQVADTAPNASAHTRLFVATIIELDEGQYVESRAFQNQTSVAALNTENSIIATLFWMYRLEA